MILIDEIQLTAPAPNAVKFGQAYPTGHTGLQQYYYWVVAHFPIGVSVSGPFPVPNAPGTLTAANSILIAWNAELNATSYDVLRTTTPNLPQATGNYALITGTTATSVIDQGQALSSYNITALQWGAPVTRKIRLNNRDYSQPTIEIDALKVTQISFADGSTQTSVAASQQVATVLLASADILALSTTPKLLVPAPGPNSYLAFSSVIVEMHQSATPYLGGSAGNIQYQPANQNVLQTPVPLSLFTTAGPAVSNFQGLVYSAPAPPINQGFYYTVSSPFTAGTGYAYLHIYYSVWNVGA